MTFREKMGLIMFIAGTSLLQTCQVFLKMGVEYWIPLIYAITLMLIGGIMFIVCPKPEARNGKDKD